MSEEDEAQEIDIAASMRDDLADIFDDLARYRMPFGKYKMRPIYDLPYEYLHWFVERGNGFPPSRIGELMDFVYHAKADGSEAIFSPLKRQTGSPDPLRSPSRDK